jgi:hypothetical protein
MDAIPIKSRLFGDRVQNIAVISPGVSVPTVRRYPDMLFGCRGSRLFAVIDMATRSAIEYRYGGEGRFSVRSWISA